MFSQKEKQKIAKKLEKILLELKHPEMPDEKPVFSLRVEGKESWSWAEIKPNWMFDQDNPAGVNHWNEKARKIMEKNTPAKHEHKFNKHGVCKNCSLSRVAVNCFSKSRPVGPHVFEADPSWLKCKGK